MTAIFPQVSHAEGAACGADLPGGCLHVEGQRQGGGVAFLLSWVQQNECRVGDRNDGGECGGVGSWIIPAPVDGVVVFAQPCGVPG